MVKLKVINQKGQNISEQRYPVKLEAFARKDIPVSLVLPSAGGGYVLEAEFISASGSPVISRRFLKVGQGTNYSYYNINPLTK